MNKMEKSWLLKLLLPDSYPFNWRDHLVATFSVLKLKCFKFMQEIASLFLSQTLRLIILLSLHKHDKTLFIFHNFVHWVILLFPISSAKIEPHWNFRRPRTTLTQVNSHFIICKCTWCHLIIKSFISTERKAKKEQMLVLNRLYQDFFHCDDNIARISVLELVINDNEQGDDSRR